MSRSDTRIVPRTWEDFLDRILVDCPPCGALAIVRVEAEGTGWDHLAYGARRMTCTRCAAYRVQEQVAHGAFSRPTMGLDLRLVAECRHGTLYAYNEAHLDHIEDIVLRSIRQERIEPGGYRNKTIASRLPRWAKASGNRDEIMKAIGRMRARITGT